MTVFDIVVMSMAFSPNGTKVLGSVQLSIRDGDGSERTRTLQCEGASSQRIPPDALLIGDAIRQMRRLPEVRSGQARLKFAKGLKPLPAAKVA